MVVIIAAIIVFVLVIAFLLSPVINRLMRRSASDLKDDDEIPSPQQTQTRQLPRATNQLKHSRQ